MQILAGILLLGVLVAFHELGHFLFAKMLGVRVLVFSVGFGPRIFSFTKGHTEYRLSIIPLGGYVRMFGESLDEDLTDEQKSYSFLHQATWRKSLIAFAGPLFNFILPIILMFFLFVGTEEVLLPQIGSIAPNSPAQKAGFKPNDLVKEINAKPIESFMDLSSIIAAHPLEELNFLVERENTNINLLVTPEEKDSQGRIGVMPVIQKPIITLLPQSPLKNYGLETLDEIVSINNTKIISIEDLLLNINILNNSVTKIIRNNKEIVLNIGEFKQYNFVWSDIVKKYTSFIDQESLEKSLKLLNEEKLSLDASYGLASAKGVVSSVAAQSIASDLNLEVNDRLLAINGEAIVSSPYLEQTFINNLNKEHLLSVIKANGEIQILGVKFKKDTENTLNLSTNLYTLFGVDLLPTYSMGKTKIRNVGVFEALSKAYNQTVNIAVVTAKSLFMLVKMEVPSSQIGGPIMLFDIAKQAFDKGLAFYIMVMCMLSVNLGLLNLLPIPALDGGHLLLFGIEAIQRKPLTPKTRAIATQIGFALLLFIMVYALFNDISRLIK